MKHRPRQDGLAAYGISKRTAYTMVVVHLVLIVGLLVGGNTVGAAVFGVGMLCWLFLALSRQSR